MTNSEKPYRLRLPGPTAVPQRIQQAIAGPVYNHRGPEAKQIMVDSVAGLRPIIGTENDIVINGSSGTGAMETAVANIIAPGDRVLICRNGQFGERFEQIATAYQADIDVLESDWGKAVDADALKARLVSVNFKAVFAIHNESSTGVVNDLKALGSVIAETDALFVVDSVSGLGGVEMRQDDWKIDILASATQKALMCPPGLGLVSVSEKAWKVIEATENKRVFYWDLLKGRGAAGKGQTQWTTPITLLAGLREAVTMISEEGLDNVLTRHQMLGDGMRAGGQALGLDIFTDAPIMSNTVTVFAMPERLDGNAVVKAMYERHNTVIAGARNWLQGKVLRIGTMGALTVDEILTDFEYLEDVLDHLGWSFQKGAGVAAARAAMSKGG